MEVSTGGTPGGAETASGRLYTRPPLTLPPPSQHVIKAPSAGVVGAVRYKQGEFVEDGKELIAFEMAKP